MNNKIRFVFLLLLLLLVSSSIDAQWVKTPGQINLPVNCFGIHDKTIFAGTPAGLVSSTDFGTTWQPNFGFAGSVDHLIIRDTEIFAAAGVVGLYHSYDYGKTWTRYSELDDIASFAIYDSIVFTASVYSGVLRFDNEKSQWNPVSTGLPSFGTTALLAKGNNLFVAVSPNRVFRSTNAGQEWVEIGTLDTGIEVTWILASSGQTLFAGTSNQGVFRSTDYGATWASANDGLKNLYVKSLYVSSIGIFAATWGGGLFLSTDDGASWEEVNDGLPSMYLYDIIETDNKLFVSTGSQNIMCQRPLAELVPSGVNGSPNKEFALVQNSPNPFNTYTTIRYSHPNREHIRITLINSLGKHESVLFDGMEDGGTYSIKLSSDNLTSGIYLIRMVSGNNSCSRVAAVLK